MDRSTLFLLALALAVFGASIIARHPAWGTFTGIAIILLAACLAVGAVPVQSEAYIDPRRQSGQRISNSPITLSSAAVVAIYAAGYYRTGSAARRVELAAAQLRASAASAEPETSPAQPGTVGPSTPPASAPLRKKTNSRPSAPIHKASPAAEQAEYKDGVYFGWGSCPHGDIGASVLIHDGKIASTAISQCLTRYTCGWIADLPGEVVARQSSTVDFVSGATESSYAFSEAVAAALSKAKQ